MATSLYAIDTLVEQNLYSEASASMRSFASNRLPDDIDYRDAADEIAFLAAIIA
jgi:hypothetical protein